MKTNKVLILTVILVMAAVFSSCDMTIALGSALNLNGPVVTITAPEPRQPVNGIFYISGTVSDYSGVDSIVIKATYTNANSENVEFPMQWRYKGRWEFSSDSGNSWTEAEPVEMPDGTTVSPQWIGDAKKADWTVPINMTVLSDELTDGQYQFIVTARNVTGLSDENSIQTRNVILYKYPPIVSVVSPFLHSINHFDISQPYIYPDSELDELYKLPDWRNPAYTGKFINGQFNLQWQIEDKNDIWAIEIRFYESEDQDGNFINPLSAANEDNYIFKMYINDILNRPLVPAADQTIRPNGRIDVPDLTGNTGTGTSNGAAWELKKTLHDGKTVINVVVSCMNAAGLEFDERITGCFIYWPQSDIPWISFPDNLSADWTKDFYTLFPETDVPAKAYDDKGVDKVEYSIYKVEFDSDTGVYVKKDDPEKTGLETNALRNKNFSWVFVPPSSITSYLIEAVVYDLNGVNSTSSGYFKTQDISWPDIKAPYTPVFTKPLYQFTEGGDVKDWTITIKGIASDSNDISGISMVWINPHSSNYSAMSQLAYFRDADYEGWTNADSSILNPYPDKKYDEEHPNKVWKFSHSDSEVNVSYYPNIKDWSNNGYNPGTGRREFEYKITLSLADDLNIWPGEFSYDYLKSQTFVFKVKGATLTEDGKDKTSIIVWSPEGASIAPYVKINDVFIERANTSALLGMDSVEQIDYFVGGEKITITGEWREDSARFQDIENVLKPYFDISIGNAVIPKDDTGNTTFTITQYGEGEGGGTWEVTAVVGNAADINDYALRLSHLRDTLMINAKVTNVGGHSSEFTKTWFVKSDKVDFMRLGSETTPDGTYNAGKVIEFYMEFNKPVKLKGAVNPVLKLNSGGTAVYQPPTDGSANTKQFFKYTVGASDSTNDSQLDITGTGDGTPAYDNGGYPFTWVTDAAEPEEIRMVITVPSTGELPYRLAAIPAGDSPAALNSVKYYVIDTQRPVLQSIVLSGRGGWYGNNNVIYMTAKFSETVYLGTADSHLNLLIKNGSSVSGQLTDSVQASGSTIIFSYRIKNNDTTDGADVVIKGFDGKIVDVAGNEFANVANFETFYTPDFRTPKDSGGLAAKVKAIPIGVPTLEIHTDSALNAGTLFPGGTSGGFGVEDGWNPEGFTDSNDFNGSYMGDIKKIGNYYSDKFFMLIKPQSYLADFDKIEYSITYGKTWKSVELNFGNNIRIENTVQGNYDITVRQSDKAGNVSPWTKPVTLYWDKGDLLTNISSTVPGGTYTANSESQDVIPIVLTFRREVNFTVPPTLTLTADNGTPSSYITLTGQTGKTTPNASNKNIHTYTVNYTVGLTDTTRGNLLNVTNITGFTAIDDKSQDVSDMINLTMVNNPDNPKNLKDQREITIQTGKPVRIGIPAFTAGAINADDSVPGTIKIQFDKSVTRGSGKIYLEQIETGYRLPGVLTETQYNLYKNIPNLSKYYKKGTNGYKEGTGPDTSTKYILDFNVDTFDTSAYSAELKDVAAALRNAEKVEIMAMSSFVTTAQLSPGVCEVTVTLNGTNSLKVPGAAYAISYDLDFVHDSLGNPCESYGKDTTETISIGYISKPFIRLLKPTETITEQAGTAANPRFYVKQQDRAGAVKVRMDSRTPDSVVRYTTAQTASNINYTAGNHNMGGTSTNAAPGRTAPVIGSTLFGSGSPLIEIGALTGTEKEYTTVQSLKYRIYAISSVGTTLGTTSAEEMLYRTVLTFRCNNIDAATFQFQNGDQLWVRGGDTLNGATIAGFPLSMDDDYTQLKETGAQAGIRLMTKIDAGNFNNSLWQWISWDITADAYISIYVGRDDVSTADEAKQYGPLTSSTQIENWSYLKSNYRLIPGEHRWLDSAQPAQSGGNGRMGPFSFNSTFSIRPVLTNTPGFVN